MATWISRGQIRFFNVGAVRETVSGSRPSFKARLHPVSPGFIGIPEILVEEMSFQPVKDFAGGFELPGVCVGFAFGTDGPGNDRGASYGSDAFSMMYVRNSSWAIAIICTSASSFVSS